VHPLSLAVSSGKPGDVTIQIEAYQHGIYPRSEKVVAATRDVERGRTTPEAVEGLFREDQDAFVRIQRDARLEYFSDGLLRWQDIFRPLVDAVEGMKARTLVRWFDNNSFFRAPELAGPLSVDSRLPAVYDSDSTVPEPRVATLPSPYLFSRAAHATGDRDDLMRGLAEGVLRPVAESLARRGYRMIHLEEPWLPFFGEEPGSWDSFEASLGSIREGLSPAGSSLVLHLYFGDAAPYAERLRRLPVDAVGIDFVETDLDALGSDWEVGILAGCLDGRRSLLESVEETFRFGRRVAEKLNPPALYLSTNSDLELLPAEVARRKVLRLGEAAQRLKEVLA
jgi:5-methyltetrahydropteroyltriglutamate--homocysteine methyltransferase